MKVDAAGLIAAAQQLIGTVETLGAGTGVPHPPLAADPASVGAAERLTAASAALGADVQAQVTAVVASLEFLTGTAISFTVTDENNAATLRTLQSGGGAVAPSGSAPPPPPVTPDVRPPLAPPVAMEPTVLSAAVHATNPGGGEPFVASHATAASTIRDATGFIRSVVSTLPQVLDTPATAEAVSQHLLAHTAGLEDSADRSGALAVQAAGHATEHDQATQSIPTPEQLAEASNQVRELAQANAVSGGRYAAPLAAAIQRKNQLEAQTMAGYGQYHTGTDKTTAGKQDPKGGADQLAQMLPQVLGALGGAVGGAMGAVTQVPQALMQAGMQAMGAATQGLSGLAQPKTDLPETPAIPTPDLGGAELGGGGASTSPAGGDGVPTPPSVAPSTGAAPTPAVTPAGATPPSAAAPRGMGGGMMPMPMGGMGGMGGGGDAKDAAGRSRQVVSKAVPHTEDVTGRTDTNRLAAASAAHRARNPEPPHDDSPPPDSDQPVIRRLVSRPPQE